MNTTDPLLTGADVARLAGVKRPAVSNWQRRRQEFPAAVHSGGTECFPLSQVLTFLDARVISPRFLAAGEQQGTTYGDRARRALDTAGLGPDNAVTSAPGARKVPQDSGQIVIELMGPVAERVQGDGGVKTDYVNLIASVAVLRACAEDRWDGLLRAAPPRQGPDEARRLLRRVGDVVDGVLRSQGILPGIGRSLDRLRPSWCADVQQVIRLAGALGAYDFPLLLDHFEREAGLTSEQFFTPPAVARMMAELTVREEGEALTICDPYLRGGELLAAAVEVVRDAGGSVASLAVHGTGAHEETLRLACMQQLLHGVQAQLGKGGGAPGADPGRPSTTADQILINPPFYAGASSHRNSSPKHPYGHLLPGSRHFAWLQHALDRLAPGGRAAVLMPNNALASDSRPEHAVRQSLVEQGVLECVVSLPARLFRGTGIPVSVWLLANVPSPSRQVLFVDARRMGVMESRTRRILTEEDASAIVQSVRAWHAGREDFPEPAGSTVFSTAADAAEICERDYSLNPADYLVQGVSAARDADELEAEYARSEGALRLAQHRMLEADRQMVVVQREQASAHEVNCAVGSSQWEERPLGELCAIQAGPSPSLIKRVRSEDGDVPVVQPTHLRDRRVVRPDQVMVPHEQAERTLQAYRVTAGDILSVRTGSTGPSALVESEQHGWLMGSNVLRIRPLHEPPRGVLPEYLLAFLSLPDVEEWIRIRSTATTSIGSISAAALGRLRVPLPAWDEQARVGRRFMAYDQRIIAHREFAEAVERSRTALAECVLQQAASVVQRGATKKGQGE